MRVVVVALLCFAAMPLRADEGDDALAHMERGLALHLAGDDVHAVVELERARATVGTGAVDLALAMSNARLGDASAADAAYGRWLDGHPDGALVASVRARMAALRRSSPSVACTIVDLKDPWSPDEAPLCAEHGVAPVVSPSLNRDLKDPWAETI